jgi:hypothetical protein
VARCNPNEQISLEDMMAKADQALYANKRNKLGLDNRQDP